VDRIFRRSSGSEIITLYGDTNESLNIQSRYILFIQAEDNYSRVVWLEGNKRKEKVMRATLKTLEEQLSGRASSDVIAPTSLMLPDIQFPATARGTVLNRYLTLRKSPYPVQEARRLLKS
jgi:hypothetical protein